MSATAFAFSPSFDNPGAVRFVSSRWLLLSLFAHALIIVAAKGLPDKPAPLPRLEVHLSLPQPAPAQAAALAPVQPVSRAVEAPKPVLTRREPDHAAPARRVPVEQPVPALPLSPPSTSSGQATPSPARGDGSPLASAAVPAAPAGPVTVAPKADDGAVFKNDLAGYGASLSRWLARHKVYPRMAQMRGWQGQVQVRVHIAKKGSVMDVEVTRSSGYEVLDRQAMEMVRAADPLPDLPLSLKGQEFTLDVPITFRLEQS